MTIASLAVVSQPVAISAVSAGPSIGSVASAASVASVSTGTTVTSVDSRAGTAVVIAAAPPPTSTADTGFGQIRYAETPGSATVSLSANVRTQITFAADPAQTQDFLNPPFAGHVFWANNRVQPRSYGDLIDVLINLIVTPLVSNGQVLADIDVGSSLGPTGTDTASLFGSAGTSERVTLRLRIQTLANFLANGAALYLTSSVPLTIVMEAILISPESTYVGAS